MTRITLVLTTLSIFAFLAIAGCGKGEDPSKMSKEQLAEKSMAIMKDFVKAAVDNKDNCDGMAAAMQKIMDDNKALIAAAKKMDDDPETKKWFDEKYKSQMTESMKPMGEAMAKCATNEKVMAVMKQMADQ